MSAACLCTQPPFGSAECSRALNLSALPTGHCLSSSTHRCLERLEKQACGVSCPWNCLEGSSWCRGSLWGWQHGTEDALARWYFITENVYCRYFATLYMPLERRTPSEVSSCLSHRRRVRRLWSFVLSFPSAVAVFLLCSKPCCWRRKTPQDRGAPSSSPELTPALWEEEAWQSPVQLLAGLLLT